jgi:hypothetical protein
LPSVQTWLVTKVAAKLSRDLQTTIRIKHVNFSLFNKMSLDSVLIEDKKHDTLLFAGALKVHITDWWFFKDTAELKYIGLENAYVKLHRTDSIWNYQFIIDHFAGNQPKPSSKKDKSEGLALDLKKLELSNIHFLKKDEWRGEDMDVRLGSLDMAADTLDLSRKIGRIHNLEFTNPVFTLTNYPGNRPEPPEDTTRIVNDPLHLRLNPGGWDIVAKKLTIRDGSFIHDVPSDVHPYTHFDGNHILFRQINASFNDLRLDRDTVTAQMQLSTSERSGLEVKKLSARIKWFPEAMEFSRFDLQTAKSHLRNFFAMRYKTFDDMSEFTDRIRMEANFTDADVNSDDIAWFAPELKDWKKQIRITGQIKGPVADLTGKNVAIEAGKNTYLNGNIRLKGLPDIDKTFIRFQSNDFRTTYQDMATLLPGIRKIEAPRLDKIEHLSFRGDFTGTIRDFITNGTIATNLGTLTTNLNMKEAPSGLSVYSGMIRTDSFQLGPFLDNPNMGRISFQGTVNGTGLNPSTLNATLDGAINSFEFNHYTYQHLQVNGAVAKKKFNGELVADDPNLKMHLNGLVDFSQELPRFDFTAEVAKADLTSLHFLEPKVEVNGKFKCNFTGDRIDNFLGSASIYGASIYKNGQRVSFDSLTLESSIVDNNKTITVVSNEFDGAIVGEFSIKDLDASFQTFLNKYYPSYIKPARSLLVNQNFSFVITTKKVDEYVDLFNKDLKGFNNGSISGRIDTRNNLLDLNVDLPSFSYKAIAFDNLVLKGRGNLDSLSMETNIGDVHLNDSLHFPSTHIRLRSASDLTDIQVKTSASQTLNSANLSARVQTLPNGVHINFDPSTFEINTKTWTIDKGGQLAFDNNIISADGLNIHSGDQQVSITSYPSSQGKWNNIHVGLKKINIGDITPYLVKSERLEGLLTGSADLSDPFGKPAITFYGDAEQFRFNNDSIGRLDLVANYQRASGLINSTVHSDNKNYRFDAHALINTADSLGSPVDITTDVAELRVGVLEKYLGGVFTNFTGNAVGKLHITGPYSHLQYLGDVQLKDAGLKVAYTQCTYTIPSALVRFRKDTIDFGSFQLKDKFGHLADLTRGRLFHHAFNDLRFDFEMNTGRFLLLDTKATDNNQFYGTVIGKAKVTLTGPEENMQMYIKGEPVDSSNIYLPPSISRESGDGDFMVWKVYGKEMKNTAPDRKSSDFTVTLDMTANNFANVFMIMDPLSGDVIKANGHGNLSMRVGTSEDLTLTGRYDIDRGNYNFSFQSFIHKPFTLSEGGTNYIQWTGNPYDATINIEATYKAENIRFSDLGLSAASGLGIQDENVKRFRGDVIVTANLTGHLMSPNIKFQIDLPANSPIKNDQEAQDILAKIQNDPNELNKQVSCLVVLNTFVPMSSSTSNFDPTSAATNVVVSSISGILSNAFSKQISNLLAKAFNSKGLRVNVNTTLYNGSNLVDNIDQSKLNLDRTNVNLSVAKSIMNERLTFTLGSALDFGMTAQQIAASSFQFLPDITAEYKVTSDGRVALTFFYRDSYNYLSSGNHTQNSSGTSISYRREFDRIDELFKKKKKKKPEQASAPLPDSTTTGSN